MKILNVGDNILTYESDIIKYGNFSLCFYQNKNKENLIFCLKELIHIIPFELSNDGCCLSYIRLSQKDNKFYQIFLRYGFKHNANSITLFLSEKNYGDGISYSIKLIEPNNFIFYKKTYVDFGG